MSMRPKINIIGNFNRNFDFWKKDKIFFLKNRIWALLFFVQAYACLENHG